MSYVAEETRKEPAASIAASLPSEGPSACCPVNDLAREVYGLLGIPIDRVTLLDAAHRIEQAVLAKSRFILSTPNLNFLVLSQSDVDFRESLLASDLCPPDGMALVWLARLLGVHMSRIAGSDIFDVLKTDRENAYPVKIFLFGGPEGLAQFVAKKINAESRNMVCVGAASPGFGTVSQMSDDSTIATINSSGADFLVAFLSARKGQEWLMHNHYGLTVPVRSHLGATINFQAGTIRRAPLVWQKVGLEWLWRVKEEPYLWRRYLRDGLALIRIVLWQALPLLIYRFASKGNVTSPLAVRCIEAEHSFTIQLHGAATHQSLGVAIPSFTTAASSRRNVVIDFSNCSSVDPRFFGLLLMLRKVLRAQHCQLRIVATSYMRRLFMLNGFGYLLPPSTS